MKNYIERKSISCKVDRFEDQRSIIKTEDGQEISWPIKDLPSGVGVGSLVNLILTTSKNNEEEQGQLAKTILNKIFKDK